MICKPAWSSTPCGSRFLVLGSWFSVRVGLLYIPRVEIAPATRPTASMAAAVRSDTRCIWAIRDTPWNAPTITPLQLRVDLALAPEELLEPLDPLEIASCYT